MKNIGIIIQQIDRETTDRDKIKKIYFGMITLARQKNSKLFAFIINADIKALQPDLEFFGITHIIDIKLAQENQANPIVRAKAIVLAVQKFNIDAVFGLSTSTGKDILPRVAAMLDAPLVMDCINVDLQPENDIQSSWATTSQYSGKTIATIKTVGKIPIFGIRPNAVEPVKAKTSAQIIKFDGADICAKTLKVISTGKNDKKANINLTEADIIISGGRGMQNSNNFDTLSKCAELLGAATGASRVAVDEGWVPYSMQVGQTGAKVSPKVYIACGISGSIQHFAGMKTSDMIIAINRDENASIISNCDYYVKADALNIIPELTKLLIKNE